jgi:flavin prenyltransferase
MSRIVVGMSGASGSILGFRTVDALIRKQVSVDLVLTDAARRTAYEEMRTSFARDEDVLNYFTPEFHHLITLHSNQDIGSTIASGSYPTHGMIIIPCSMATLAAVACGLSDSLLRRAADVTIKEGRPFIIVPRETPFSPIHLENMLTLARLNITIMPPVPSWYLHPRSLEEMESMIVTRVLDRIFYSRGM